MYEYDECMARKGKLYLGTSGWMYKDWGKTFYPEGMREGHLAFLAQEFNSVEVNTSFYHLPRTSTFRKWAEETPADFTFALKLSRYITHEKKLQGVRGALERFIRHAKPVSAKLGVILVQLPPWLRYRQALLNHFLDDLHVVSARNYPVRFALEPRHVSWMSGESALEVTEILRRDDIALVFAHSKKIPSYPPQEKFLTASYVYVRFHGPSEFAASRYGPSRLRPWAARIAGWMKRGLDVFVYFNNDVHGHAVHDARTLVGLLQRRGNVPYSKTQPSTKAA